MISSISDLSRREIEAMEAGKCRDRSRVRDFLTHFLPMLQKIKKRRSSRTQRQRAIRLAADMFLVHIANKDKGSAWSRALNLRLMRREKTLTTMKMNESSLLCRKRRLIVARRMRLASLNSRFCNNLDIKTGGHDDHGAFGRRLRILGRLVPGGRKMAVDTLFQETADYILNLEIQVQAMEALAAFYTTNSAGRVEESVAQKHQAPSRAAQI